MPIYEYQCSNCRKVFEYLAKKASDSPGACPKCGCGESVRLPAAFALSRSGVRSAHGSECGSCAGGDCPYSRR